jgi:CelD/BcsL family acetyltransferase involved in cellulose biosynthesis
MASAAQMPLTLQPLATRRWSVAEWHQHGPEWQALMARSAADPLFLSFEWLSSWWDCFGESLGQSPEVLAFYRGPQLAGLAPLYRQRVLRSGILPAHSVQMMGLAWRDPEPLISEYLDVIGEEADLPLLREACVRQLLQDPAWSEFVIGFTTRGTQWREAYQRCVGSERHYVRELDRSVAYQADLSCGFAAYLAGLEQSTRRSLWNLRHRLGGSGEVRLESVAQEDIARAFEDLNRLHRLRWQRPAFTGRRLRFHTTLAQRLAARGELALSRLHVAGEVVSVLYDIRKGARQYNIKMAFDPAFSSRVSLGLIHLGFAMEAACERGVRLYDLLAGPGRASDYKRHLSQERRALSCVQMLRGPMLPRLYRWRDRRRLAQDRA